MAALHGLSQILEGLAFDQVGLQHFSGHAVHLVQHAIQPVQVFIDLTSLCWLHRVGTQVDDLACLMALNGGSPALWANPEFVSKFLFAEKRLPDLFAFTWIFIPAAWRQRSRQGIRMARDRSRW